MQKSKLIEKIRCDACPIMCFIAEGKYGACDRYANKNGKIVRLDPLLILNNCINSGMKIKPFLNTEWNGESSKGAKMASGVYFLKIKVKEYSTGDRIFTDNQKMMLLK